MPDTRRTSPLTQAQLIEEYWMEHRVQVLEIAAYLDRLDRAAELDAADDFRLVAMRHALDVLRDGRPDRIERVQMLFSDPRTELLPELDRKAAWGAFDRGAAQPAGGEG